MQRRVQPRPLGQSVGECKATAPFHTYMSPITQLNRTVLKSSCIICVFILELPVFGGFEYGSHSLYSVAYLDNPSFKRLTRQVSATPTGLLSSRHPLPGTKVGSDHLVITERYCILMLLDLSYKVHPTDLYPAAFCDRTSPSLTNRPFY